MSDKKDTLSWKERLKKIPKTFVAYKKDGIAAIDEAKKERSLLAPLFFSALLFCSCVFLIGAHFRGVDYWIDNSDSFLNDLALLKSVSVFSVGSALLWGLILFAVLLIVFVFTRFGCIMIFSRGSKGKTVFLESVIEFGMDAVPLTFFFLISGVLSDLVWWSFYPLFSFFALFFILMLTRSVFAAVDRKKQTSLLVFVMAVFIFIALVLINALMIAVMGYSLLTVAQGVYENIAEIFNNIKAGFESIFGSIFKS
ncbi:MAG: hypothetical protein IJH32_10860 [Ruminococcus sp.]|nr:hypothetical protein [Ruminococcus sp.]